MVKDSLTPSNIWIDALSRYKEETGFDLAKERTGHYRDLHDCNSPEDALRLIAGLVDAPHIAQEKRTRLAFTNVLKFVLASSDAMAELAGSLQIPGGKAILVSLGILLRTVQNMQDRLSVLAELLFKFEQFFCRIDLRRDINYPVRDQEILTRICAEFLHVLALAQKIVGRHTYRGFRGRFQRIRHRASNFREALLDNSDIKSAMCRLDDLTHMELQITAAQTLRVVAETKAEVQNVQTMGAQTFQEVAETRAEIRNVQTMVGAIVRSSFDSQPPNRPSTSTWQPATTNSIDIGTVSIVFRLFAEYLEDDTEKARFSAVFLLCILFSPGPLSPIDRLRLAPLIILPLLVVPRVLSLQHTAVLVDVMGERRPLYKEMWRTPQTFADTLRRFFRGNDEVLRLIDAQQYRIQDEDTSVYEPGSSRVRSGTTLYMAAILFTRTIHCPWCSTQVPVSQGWNLQSFVSCSTCGRKFSTSNTNSIRTETVPEEYGRMLSDELYRYLLVDEYARPQIVSRQVFFRFVHLMLTTLELARVGLVGKKVAKKPPLACLFCRGRNIACGRPSASWGAAGESGGSEATSGSGACSQCQRRSLVCVYPTESRRGMRKKKAMPEGPPSSSGLGSSSLPSSASSDTPIPIPHMLSPVPEL